MPHAAIKTVRDQIAWSYANLARAHAALADGRVAYIRTDHMVRAKLYAGLRSQRMAMGSIYDDERLKALSDRVCAYCDAVERLSMDHLIPRIAGGGDDGANLVIACRSCNSSKNGADLIAWYSRRGGFPRLLLIRRYLKLVATRCDADGALDWDMDDPRVALMPFQLDRLPAQYPSLVELRL